MMPLTSLPPDRNLVASLMTTPVVTLLMLPEMRTYRLERTLMPRTGSAATIGKKLDPATFSWLFTERILLSPVVLLVVSLLSASLAWFSALSGTARRGLALTLFLLLAGLTEPIYVPHTWSDLGSLMAEGRLIRSMRHRADMSEVAPA